MLNQEWLMICWFSSSNSEVPDHIEIQRKHKSKRCSVSGEIQCTDQTSWKQDFSLYFGPGCKSNKFEIPFHALTKFSDLTGHVVISEEPENLALEEIDEKDLLLKSLDELSNDFALLLEPKYSSFADIHLKCGSVIFPAHKIILSVRWPFFLDMFSSQITEKQKNEVILTEIDAPVFEIMLTYIYTGKIKNLAVPLAGDVLFASDKYRVEGLKTACCECIKRNISIENAIETLMLGDLHYPDLKISAMEFICQNCDEFPSLEKTEKWQVLLKERASLALEVLTSIVNAKGK
ncbi:TD and POZ domain-containing protein 5 [Trichonephila clavata]|uniref:TD and POZ domain-containing protein 5 n=1 Tax=Trichonephila clavata TaxID=2740835 RepID=A0A8X6HNP9_TRICU|nr:TD and POZ domain-containing protein 5 [Trichonephila clavata]